MKNNKLRIFYSSLLLLLASFLISISINLPVNIENYKNIVLNQNNPYKSVVYYQSNPYNSPNFSFKNRDISPDKILIKFKFLMIIK
ncbi:hypothetical protein JTY60_00150 [symbiont of Argiope bruennichi]|uniref:hypothetical protein n=1 Tax=symbiont of Argiope bruennichi TaxID=2810479 RepID=UPI003DA3EC55